MNIRKVKYSDYGFSVEEVKRLKAFINSDDFCYQSLLHKIADEVNHDLCNELYDSLIYGESYEKLSGKEYIPINKTDFYSYQRLCLIEFARQIKINFIDFMRDK